MSSNALYIGPPPALLFPVPSSPSTEPGSPYYNSGFRSCSNPSSIHASDEDLSRELTRTSYSGAKVHLVPGMFSDPHQTRTRAITMPSDSTAPLNIPRKSSAISMSMTDPNRPGGLDQPSLSIQEMGLSSVQTSFPPARSDREVELAHPDEEKYMTSVHLLEPFQMIVIYIRVEINR